MCKTYLKAKKDIKIVERFILHGEAVIIRNVKPNGEVMISNEANDLFTWLTNDEFLEQIEIDLE